MTRSHPPPSSRWTPFRVAACLGAAGLIVAACSSEDDDSAAFAGGRYQGGQTGSLVPTCGLSRTTVDGVATTPDGALFALRDDACAGDLDLASYRVFDLEGREVPFELVETDDAGWVAYPVDPVPTGEYAVVVAGDAPGLGLAGAAGAAGRAPSANSAGAAGRPSGSGGAAPATGSGTTITVAPSPAASDDSLGSLTVTSVDCGRATLTLTLSDAALARLGELAIYAEGAAAPLVAAGEARLVGERTLELVVTGDIRSVRLFGQTPRTSFFGPAVAVSDPCGGAQEPPAEGCAVRRAPRGRSRTGILPGLLLALGLLVGRRRAGPRPPPVHLNPSPDDP